MPDKSIIPDENERAKRQAESETHYGKLLDSLLTEEQKAIAKDAEENPVGKPHGVRSDAVASHKRRGFHQGKRTKRN